MSPCEELSLCKEILCHCVESCHVIVRRTVVSLCEELSLREELSCHCVKSCHVTV